MLYVFRAVSPPIVRSSRTVHTTSGMCQACYTTKRIRTAKSDSGTGLPDSEAERPHRLIPLVLTGRTHTQSRVLRPTGLTTHRSENDSGNINQILTSINNDHSIAEKMPQTAAIQFLPL